MFESHLYSAATDLDHQQPQITKTRNRLRCFRCARTIVAMVFLVFATSAANAVEYDERYALLIGLGKYESGPSKGIFRDLYGVANDLDTVAGALETVNFDKNKIYIYSDLIPDSDRDHQKMVEIKYQKLADIYFKKMIDYDANGNGDTLVGADKINGRILQTLDFIKDNSSSPVQKKILLLIYFTGHGGLTGISDRVLAAPQSKIGDAGTFAYVSRILKTLENRTPPYVDVMIVADACADKLRDMEQDDYPEKLNDEKLPVQLYSSDLGEASFFDPKLNKSIFTHYFVLALSQADDLGNGDYTGTIDSDSIINYVKQKVPLHKEMEQKKNPNISISNLTQHPWGASGKSNIVLGTTQKRIIGPPPDNATDVERKAHFELVKKFYYGGAK